MKLDKRIQYKFLFLLCFIFTFSTLQSFGQVVGPYTGIDHATDYTNPDTGPACGSIADINAAIGDADFTNGAAEVPLGWSFSGTWASGASYMDGAGDEVLLVSLHTYTESWNVALRLSDGTTTTSLPYDLTLVTSNAVGSLATCGTTVFGFDYERPSQVLDFADYTIPAGVGVIGIVFEPFADGAANPDPHGVMVLDGTPLADACDALDTDVSSTSLCIGEELTLEATSTNGGTITWDMGVDNGVAFTPTVGTVTYTATSDNADDCSFSVEVIVHDLPEITASVDDESICLGESIIFTGGGGTTYTWDMGVTDGVPFEPTTIGTETYTVTGEDANGCTNTASVDVNVGDAPDVNFEFVIGGSSSEDGLEGGCILNDVQFNDLTIVPGGSITGWNWNFGDGGTSTEENPIHSYSAAGTYTITLTIETDGGCSSTFDLDIIMTESLSLDFIISEPTCYELSDGSVTVNVTGGAGELTFEITNADGDIENEDGSNTANTLRTGWYYFNVNDETGCGAIDSVFIDQPEQLDIDLTTQDANCHGEASGWARVNNVYNPTGDPDLISYFWTPNPAGEDGIGEDSTWALEAGTYNIIINDENGCTRTFDFVIEQPDEIYLAEFGMESAFCRLHEYQSGGGVVFGAASGGTGDFIPLWTNLETGDTWNNGTWGGLNPGTYEFTSTDENGCVIKETIELDSLVPIAGFTIESDQLNSDCQGTAPVEVEFTNTSINVSNPNDPSGTPVFLWSLDTLSSDWSNSYDINEKYDTIYGPRGVSYTVEACLIAQNQKGCQDMYCKEITIFEELKFTEVNIFTPNNDGKNDVFTFSFRSASVSDFNCVIVNRWGIKVAELNHITDTWDGTDFGGSICKDGVYFYVYEGKADNNETISGQGKIQLVSGN